METMLLLSLWNTWEYRDHSRPVPCVCVHACVCTHTCTHPSIHCFPIKRKPLGIESLTSSLNECKESMYRAEGERTASPAWSPVSKLIYLQLSTNRQLEKDKVVLGGQVRTEISSLLSILAYNSSGERYSFPFQYKLCK